MDIKSDNMNSPIVWLRPNNVTILLLLILLYMKTPQQYYYYCNTPVSSTERNTINFIPSVSVHLALDKTNCCIFVSMQAQEM